MRLHILWVLEMKLYWRYKKDGKWTWKPVQIDDAQTEFVLLMERSE